MFDRPGGPKPVRITPLGKLVLAHARELLDKARATAEAIERFKAGEGRIDIGTFQSVSNVLLPLIVMQLRQEHPAIDLRVFEEETAVERLLAGELDLAYWVGPPDGPIESVKLLDDPYVLVSRRGDFPDGPVRCEQLDGVQMVSFPRLLCDIGRVEDTLAGLGVEPLIVFRTADNGAVLSMVRAGMGAAVMPMLAIDINPDDDALCTHELLPAIRPREVCVMWQAGRTVSPLARRVDRHLGVGRPGRGRTACRRSPPTPAGRLTAAPPALAERSAHVYSCQGQQTPSIASEGVGEGDRGEMVRQPRVLGQRPQRHRGVSAEELRRHNLSLLVDHIHLSGSASRSQLATLTGLNRSTIADLVAELVELGLVVERPTTVATGPGRPSRVVAAQPAGAVVVAIELAVDSIAVATVGLSGHVFNRVRVDRPRGRFSPAETLDDVASLAEPLLGALPEQHRLTGVGVAVVGITRTSDGFVHFAPNLGWRDVPLGELTSARLGFGVPVSVANEADLGALSEHRRGVDAGVANLLFVSGEVGIGLGVILGGERRLGAAGYAGEAGHMLVNPAGVRCRCGAVGCWETEAGEEALLRAACPMSTAGQGGPASTACWPAPPQATRRCRTPVRGSDTGSASALVTSSTCSIPIWSCSEGCSADSIRLSRTRSATA